MLRPPGRCHEVGSGEGTRGRLRGALWPRCILHNNVGIVEVGGPVEISEENWDKVMDTNLKSMFLTCKYVLPHMVKQGCGAIVNISSIGSMRYIGYPSVSYNASKGAINQLTQNIAIQYARQGN